MCLWNNVDCALCHPGVPENYGKLLTLLTVLSSRLLNHRLCPRYFWHLLVSIRASLASRSFPFSLCFCSCLRKPACRCRFLELILLHASMVMVMLSPLFALPAHLSSAVIGFAVAIAIGGRGVRGRFADGTGSVVYAAHFTREKVLDLLLPGLSRPARLVGLGHAPLLLFRPIPSLSTTSSAHRILLPSADTPRSLSVPATSISVLVAVWEGWVVVLGPERRCSCGADIVYES